MSRRASGARLGSAQFLSDFLTNLSALLVGKSWSLWRGLITVKLVLSEILEEGNNTQPEPHTSQHWELDSDTEDETWVKEWAVQELFAWMLLEARAADLPEESHHLVEQLEQR
ncbi:hypothetical protein FS837_007421 [Tulasnella sp. UAMH 9824]|nr:hypothetical protein FS837_007421 [Tulasnella sp. UAMH 9824]